ncbi:MAG TPA: riboflavin biosynthesis protein RibF [Opitutus sp.]|nr:riboflavin biosynthesis protein RibF [Opitutus sp.]
MSLPVQFDGLHQAVLSQRPLHLAIGIFDGVHLGHRAVIEAAVHSAHRSHGQAAVLTFAPHPSVLFRPESPTRMMMDGSAKARLLGTLGVEVVITQPFTHEFAQTAAEDFLPLLKRHLPQLVAVYVGENWRFGRGRGGDIALLVSEGRRLGLSVFSAPRVNLNGEPISSSRIREAIESGEIASANMMLGYVYFAQGVVLPGKKLGRTLGFPTLNLAWSPDLRPRFGVYVVRVSGGKTNSPLKAVANYGLRPTVEQTAEPRLEVHVLGVCPFDVGDEITVEWLHFLRPEKKFANVEELRIQIGRDRDAAEIFFARSED